jgi:hypothetical protein
VALGWSSVAHALPRHASVDNLHNKDKSVDAVCAGCIESAGSQAMESTNNNGADYSIMLADAAMPESGA